MEYQSRNRSSSTTISIAGEPTITTEGVADDVFIAQALLNNSRNIHDHQFTLQIQTESLPLHSPPPIPQRRQHAGTSNTWTSSEGEMPSVGSELDNRAVFVTEYNRIAERVYVVHCSCD